jgi:selenocysteine lyase/cysteine desulfurase
VSLDHGHVVNPSDEFRGRFSTLERLTYLNSCSQGALSTDVTRAYERYLADWQREGSPWELWVEQTELVRAAFAGLVGGSASDVAVTTSVSAAVSALASGLRFDGERRKVVLSELEFPTVGQIWHAQEQRGAEVVHPADPAAQIDDETLIASVTHVSYETGARLDVAAVVEAARAHGALVLLDAYQSVGAIPVDVGQLGVDFVTAGTVKYLCGSAGLAFLWCRPAVADEIRPTATGWFADENVFAMDATRYAPAPGAARFQSGTPPVPSVYAGLAAIELVREVGVERTEAHVRGLTETLIAGIEELGGRVVTPAASGPLVAVPARDAEALVAGLRDDGSVTSARAGNLRISPHFYNSDDDIHTVLAALERHRALLA